MRLYGDCNVYYYPNKKTNPYKIIFHKQCFRAESHFAIDEPEQQKVEFTEGEKLLNNIVRVKSRVRDYAFCNDWEYFVTFTFNQINIDRYDLKEIKKQMGKFFNNYKNRKNSDFRYLLVPEFHQDGAVHFHGLVSGISFFDLYEFSLSDKLPSYISGQIKKGLKIYDFVEFSKRFGFTTVEPIRDVEAAALYITKYITKDLVSLPLHTCCYLNSKGLKLPELVHQDFGGILPKKNDYENDFVAIKWLSDLSSYSQFVMDV